jgi:hypothetical protein
MSIRQNVCGIEKLRVPKTAHRAGLSIGPKYPVPKGELV